MLSEQLKKDTHKAHIEVEKLIIPAIKKLGSYDSYIKLLKTFYGYFKPLEQEVDKFITPGILPDINERRKSNSIVKDISYFNNVNAPEIPLCVNLPEINNTSQAFGAMYVLEGSTLGGVHLSKMISERMKITGERGIEFFSGYGPETLEKWKVFKNRLDEFGREELSGIKVIDAANDTFSKFKLWIEMN